eukprot:scaffold1786_cov398-Prasinococcus_capsulatus_cf.AAC.15
MPARGPTDPGDGSAGLAKGEVACRHRVHTGVVEQERQYCHSPAAGTSRRERRNDIPPSRPACNDSPNAWCPCGVLAEGLTPLRYVRPTSLTPVGLINTSVPNARRARARCTLYTTSRHPAVAR